MTSLLELLSFIKHGYACRLFDNIGITIIVKIFDLGRSAIAGVVSTFVFATVCGATANRYLYSGDIIL